MNDEVFQLKTPLTSKIPEDIELILQNISNYNKYNLEDESNYEKNEEDISTLEEMGYNQDLINKVYLYLNPQSKEKAIQYMTKQNGIYNHNFYNKTDNHKSTCSICGEEPKFHINYNEEKLINTNSNKDIILNSNDKYEIKLINDSNNNNDYKTYTCAICFQLFLSNELPKKKISCNHIVCKSCWVKYLTNKIKSEVSIIKCIVKNCLYTLNNFDINHYIKGDLYNNYVNMYPKYDKNKDILSENYSENSKPCPEKFCSGYLEKNDNEKLSQCEYGHKFCFDCLRPWEYKDNCDIRHNKDKQEKEKENSVKLCPNCRYPSQRKLGFNIITCSQCKFKWCYICQEKYTEDHFIKGECKGNQFVLDKCSRPVIEEYHIVRANRTEKDKKKEEEMRFRMESWEERCQRFSFKENLCTFIKAYIYFFFFMGFHNSWHTIIKFIIYAAKFGFCWGIILVILLFIGSIFIWFSFELYSIEIGVVGLLIFAIKPGYFWEFYKRWYFEARINCNIIKFLLDNEKTILKLVVDSL